MATPELKDVIEDLGKGFEEFKNGYNERLEALEKGGSTDLEGRVYELETRAGRVGVLGAAGFAADEIEPEGFKTFTAETLKSKQTIAAKLGKSGGQSVRMGDFVRAVAGMKVPDHVKGLTEATDAEGGFTVPEVLLPGILAALAPASSLISAGARVVTLDTQAKSFGVAGIDTLPVAGWRKESASVAESDPVFRGLTITPKSLAFFFKLSRELLQDSPGLDQALTNAISQAFAKAIDKAGLLGSGTNPEPKGLANISGVHDVDSGANGTALADYSSFLKAMGDILGADAPTPTAAIMAPRTLTDIAGLQDTTNQPLRRPDAIANWRMIQTSQIPVDDTVGTSSDCSRAFVGDFSNFSIFMREQLSIQMVRELFADKGQLGFFAHARVDVAAMYPSAFAIIKGIRPASAS